MLGSISFAAPRSSSLFRFFPVSSLHLPAISPKVSQQGRSAFISVEVHPILGTDLNKWTNAFVVDDCLDHCTTAAQSGAAFSNWANLPFILSQTLPPRLDTAKPDFYVRAFSLHALIRLFSEPQYLSQTKPAEDESGFAVALTEIDYEEQSVGYQAAYSRLAASETTEADVVAYVPDPQKYLGEWIIAFARTHGQGALQGLLSRGNPAVTFVQQLAAAGYSI